jgi:calcineurin-like phosphoesterase family protein
MFPEFGLVLTHIPMSPFGLDRREGGEVKYTLSNVHGHIHNEYVTDEDQTVDLRYQNVCVEMINYTPVNIEDLRTK